jgi:Fungal specific transcription factor domain
MVPQSRLPFSFEPFHVANILREFNPPVDLVFHLIEVFDTFVHSQQFWLFQHETFLECLTEASCTKGFVLAACAIGARFSRHRSVMSPSGRLMRKHFAANARLHLASPTERAHILDRLRCLCLLVVYEMAEGNGTQAWCDIGETLPLRLDLRAC